MSLKKIPTKLVELAFPSDCTNFLGANWLHP